MLNLLSDIISSLLENTEDKNHLTNTYFNTQILASRNRNSTFHSFGMWRGGGVHCRLTRQWSYLHCWFLKKYFLQIHFSYYFVFFYYLALQKYLTPWFKFLFISLAWLPVHRTRPSLLLVTILNTEDHNNNPRHKSWNTYVIFPSPMLIWVCSHFSAPKYARLNIGEEEPHIRVTTKVSSVNVRNLGVQHVGVWQKQIMTLKKKYNLNQR